MKAKSGGKKIIKATQGTRTDQSVARVCPVEFDAHVELGDGGAAQHQLLPSS